MGDFLRLNLSAGFVQAWDTWLQEAMLAARERFGDRWNDRYLSAPIWRFTLPGGQAGESAVSGILMASVDRVGRQFPLTLVAPHEGNNTALIHFANRATFEQLEDIALTALEEETPRDALADALAKVTLSQFDSGDIGMRRYRGATPPDAALAAQVINKSHGSTGIWTTAMAGDHRMLLRPDLPDAADVLGLFDLDADLWRPSPKRQPA